MFGSLLSFLKILPDTVFTMALPLDHVSSTLPQFGIRWRAGLKKQTKKNVHVPWKGEALTIFFPVHFSLYTDAQLDSTSWGISSPYL